MNKSEDNKKEIKDEELAEELKELETESTKGGKFNKITPKKIK